MTDRLVLDVAVDPDSPVPAFRQIADGLRSQFVFGEIAAGVVLPSGRQLAEELGVHHNTVAQAYRQLAAEGWLELKRKTGARVLERVAPAETRDTREYYRRRLRDVVAAMRAEGLPPEAIRAEMEEVLGRH